MIELRDYQTRAIEAARQKILEGRSRIILQAPTGCHRPGQKVVMADGSTRRVEEVRVGDALMGVDGTPRAVRSLCAGRQKMVRIVPATGSPFVVNLDHILTLIRGDGRRDGPVVDVVVRDWLTWSKRTKSLYDLFRIEHPSAEWRKKVTKTTFRVDALGEEPYLGFTLAGDGRYLLDDGTVTHNSGKTPIAASIIRSAAEKGKRSLLVAHRKELIDQAVEKLVAFGVDERTIGVTRSGDRRARPDALVQVASIASLRLFSSYELIVVDECHRSAAKSYAPLFDYASAANLDKDKKSVVILGLTATVARLDGKPLDMYDEIVVVAQPSELIASGHIVAPRIFTVPEDMLPDLSAIRSRGGEYNQDELAEAVNKRALVGSIVDHWLERAGGMRTIVFATGIEHSKAIRDEFVARGVKAEHTDGTLADGDRDGVLARLRRGETRVVCQCDLYVEGLDAPEVRCAVLARPTQSLTILLQSCGRVMRPFNGEPSLILDHAGNIRVHGLPTEDRTYSLTGRVKRTGSGEAPVRTCPECYAVLPVQARTCPECSHVFRVDPKTPAVVEGTLVEVDLDEAALRQNFWGRLVREAQSLGYQRGWAAHKFKDRYGAWPPSSYAWPDGRERRQASDAVRRAELNKLRAIAHRTERGDAWAEERYAASFGEAPRALIERETSTRLATKAATVPSEKTSTTPDEELDVGI